MILTPNKKVQGDERRHEHDTACIVPEAAGVEHVEGGAASIYTKVSARNGGEHGRRLAPSDPITVCMRGRELNDFFLHFNHYFNK